MSIDLTAPIAPPEAEHLPFGGVAPDGRTLGVNSRYLTRDGRPWVPVMGEVHYARLPQPTWERELTKVQALGVDVVATYAFWIHHEEVRGEFDFTGRRDLGKFVRLCGDLGLFVWLRIGPWSHGECRNGGFPDWLLETGCTPRTNDPAYLDHVRPYWRRLAREVAGASFEEGGPIIGLQLENELMQNGPHLSVLRQLAAESGFRAPFFSVTGWGEVEVPEGLALPVFGGYADGFWERTTDDWPLRYRKNYFFRHARNDTSIGNDLGELRLESEPVDPARYPYLTGETGGGMPSAYHRRIELEAMDTVAIQVAMVGSGSNLQGYYMLHGGSNPPGKRSSLQESQATGYPNDLPLIPYFADAPIGDYGQINPSYRPLRRLHAFLCSWGEQLAPCVGVLPHQAPSSLEDLQTLRWAVRHDGRRGFVFVNNHQRLERLPDHGAVRFELEFPEGTLAFPERPIEVPSGACFILPVRMDLGGGAELVWATAQPLARVGRLTVLGALAGIRAELELSVPPEAVSSVRGMELSGTTRARLELLADTGGRATVAGPEGVVEIMVVPSTQADDIALLHLDGQDRLLRSRAALRVQGGVLRAVSDQPEDLTVEDVLTGRRWPVPLEPKPNPTVHVTATRPAGALRTVRLGAGGVAQAPPDEAFAEAAEWTLEVGRTGPGLFLELDYVGDVARLHVDDRLLCDHFSNGAPWLVGLEELGVGPKTLRLQVLPFDLEAPIGLPREARARVARYGPCALRYARVARTYDEAVPIE